MRRLCRDRDYNRDIDTGFVHRSEERRYSSIEMGLYFSFPLKKRNGVLGNGIGKSVSMNVDYHYNSDTIYNRLEVVKGVEMPLWMLFFFPIGVI